MIRLVSEEKGFLFDTQLLDTESGYVAHHVVEHYNEFSDDHWVDAHLTLHDGRNTIDLKFVCHEGDHNGCAKSIMALYKIVSAAERVAGALENFVKEKPSSCAPEPLPRYRRARIGDK